MSLKTIIYSNPISAFGLIFIKRALQSNVLKIDELVLSTQDLSWQFHLKLKKEKLTPIAAKTIKKYHHKNNQIRKWTQKYSPKTQIRYISDANTADEANRLKNYQFAFCAAFPQIFQSCFFQAPKVGVVNFHPSFLPRCRGAHPIYWTIANQEKFGGISSHFITKKIDQGLVIHRLKIKFDPYQITYKKLFNLIDSHLSEALERCVYNLKNDVHASIITEEVSFNLNENDEDRIVCWHKDSVDKISRRIRAGGAFACLDNRQKVYLGYPLAIHTILPNDKKAGTVLKKTMKGVLIQAIDGQILCQLDFSYTLFEKILLFVAKINPSLRQLALLILWNRRLHRRCFI